MSDVVAGYFISDSEVIFLTQESQSMSGSWTILHKMGNIHKTVENQTFIVGKSECIEISGDCDFVIFAFVNHI